MPTRSGTPSPRRASTPRRSGSASTHAERAGVAVDADDLLEDAALPGPELPASEDRALQAAALARRTHAPEARSRSSSWPGTPSPSTSRPARPRCPARRRRLARGGPGGRAARRRAAGLRRRRAEALGLRPPLHPRRRARRRRAGSLDLPRRRRTWRSSTDARLRGPGPRPARPRPALDSGLTPGETRRQIDCGLAHARRQAGRGCRHERGPIPGRRRPARRLAGRRPQRHPADALSGRRSGELARLEIGPGLVTLLGGAPGAGKTALTMQLVFEALERTPSLRALRLQRRDVARPSCSTASSPGSPAST